MATNTAASFTNHTGNASAGPFSISFSYLDESEVDVTVDGVLKTKTTHYTFPSATTISFTSGNHPANGTAIKFQRDTNISAKKVDFQDGSVLTEADLDNNSDQILYGLQEFVDSVNNDLLKRDGSHTVTGNLVFEGSTDDGNETTLAITDPTADRTITVPNITGTIVTTGDTGTVTRTMINDTAVDTAKIASNAVTTAKINDAAVTSAKIASNAVTTAKINDAAVDTAKIASNAVTTAKINDDAVTSAKIADNAVTTGAIGSAQVTSVELSTDSVQTAKILNNAVTTAKIADANITTAKLADDAVTAAKIADGAITSAHIAADTVVAADIAANAVTASELADNAVDTAAIAADAVTGAKIADDAVDSEHLAADSIDAEHYAPGSVDATALASNAVTTAKINADAVDGTKIADDAINSEHYTDGSIDTAHIADAQITTAKIADDAVTAAKVGTFNLADLTNVHTSSPNDGQVLKWINSNSRWEPANDAGAGGATLADADYGDITVSSSGAVFTIDNGVVTTAKIADDAITGAKLSNNLDIPDSNKIRFGTGNDLEIYHDPQYGHSFIKESGSGALIIGASTFEIYNADISEKLISATADGAVELYYDGSLQFKTASYGLDFADNKRADFGAGNDLLIYHNGTHSFLQHTYGSGNFFIESAAHLSLKVATDETAILANANGAVDLYYDGSKKIETTNTGISVSGKFKQIEAGETTLTIGSSDAGGAYLLLDGDSNGDGSGGDYAAIGQDTSGNLIIQSRNPAGTGNITLKVAGTESAIVANANGALELYFDNSKKFQTYSGGIQHIEDVWFDNNTTAGRDVFWDSSEGLMRFYDSAKANFGTGDDLQIYHDGSYSYIKDAGTGSLILQTNQFLTYNAAGDELMIVAGENGSVELYYDNSKKFETLTGGAKVHGAFTATADLNFNVHDNQKIKLGGSSDLELFHDGSNSYITNGTGKLYIDSDNDDIMLQSGQIQIKNAAGDEHMAWFDAGGSCALYHNNNKRLDTTNGGLTVQGSVTETSDVALKEDIKSLSNSLTNLKQLNGYSYKFKETGIKSLGLTAQEVEKVYPDLVSGEEGKKTLQYSGLIAPLLEAIKELSTEVDTLKTKVAALESA